MSLADDGNDRITTAKAANDLKYIWVLFGSIVGAPSILSLLQMVIEHRLVDTFQWIVDGYNAISDTIGAIVEPFLSPLLEAIGELFGLAWSLHPHWRPLFILGMIVVIAFSRSLWRYRLNARAVMISAALCVGVLIGALVAGLISLQGEWWLQGVAATAPIAALFLAALLIDVFPSKGGYFDKWEFIRTCVRMLRICIAAFVLSSLLALVRGNAPGSAVLGLFILVFVYGAYLVLFGLGLMRKPGEIRVGREIMGDWAPDPTLRMGLVVLGGFLTAGAILVADHLIKDSQGVQMCNAVAPSF